MILNVQKEVCKTCQDKKCNSCELSLHYIMQGMNYISYIVNQNYIYILPFQNQYWYVYQPLKDITLQLLALIVKYGISISKQKYDSIKLDNVKRHYKKNS